MISPQLIRKIYSSIFPDIDLDNTNEQGKVQVYCPFHQDNKKSAGINPSDGFFNCFTCEEHRNLTFEKFIMHYYKTNSVQEALKLIKIKDQELNLNDADLGLYKLCNDADTYWRLVNSLEIDHNTICNLKLAKTDKSNYLVQIPILIDGSLYGYKFYEPFTKSPEQPKSYTTTGIPNGLIIPHDLWVNDPRPTLICEGEKDMLIARSRGFNSICFTGGCKAHPLMSKYFEGKEVYIAYDNDEAGKEGAAYLANYLWTKTKGNIKIKILTNLYAYIPNNKEDIFNFFCKDTNGIWAKAGKVAYGNTPETLQWCIDNSPYLTELDIKTMAKSKSLEISFDDSQKSENLTKRFKSTVQVTARYPDVQAVPKTLYIKYRLTTSVGLGNKDITFGPEQTYEIDLSAEENIPLAIKLVNMGKAIAQQKQFIDALLRQVSKSIAKENDIEPDKINFIETNLSAEPYWNLVIESNDKITLYRTMLSSYKPNDDENDSGKSVNRVEKIEADSCYSYCEMGTAQAYKIDYQVFSNLSVGRRLTYIVYDAEPYNDIQEFHLSNQAVNYLTHFNIVSDIYNKLYDLFNEVKSAYGLTYLDFNLWLANELVFNSPLEILFKNKLERGALYLNVIGDTRVGKSEISSTLTYLYGQGKKVNAKLTSINGLVGGYDEKTKAIKAGVFSRANRNLLVLEEIHGEDIRKQYFTKITEVKSSNAIKLARVCGELELDCFLRIIEISNPVSRSKDTQARPVADFPNGVTLIRNLISGLEDIARNDLYVIATKQGYINPLPANKELKDFLKPMYREKIKWVWSRKPNQILFQSEQYIIDRAKELMEEFDCNDAPIFNNEAPKKLMRLSTALAAMLVSTTDWATIYVTNQHVDFMVEWLKTIYNSEYMRLGEYAKNDKEFDKYDPQIDVYNLEKINENYPEALSHLYDTSETDRNRLLVYAGGNGQATIISQLSKGKFIRTQDNTIYSTQKFRKSYKQILLNQETSKINNQLYTTPNTNSQVADQLKQLWKGGINNG